MLDYARLIATLDLPLGRLLVARRHRRTLAELDLLPSHLKQDIAADLFDRRGTQCITENDRANHKHSFD